jgi:hypothetical protein
MREAEMTAKSARLKNINQAIADGDKILIVNSDSWARIQRMAAARYIDEESILKDAISLEQVYIDEIVIREGKMMIQKSDGRMSKVTSFIDVRDGGS